MWTCANCREVIEDQFDACWQCGTSREGKLNLDFVRELSPAPHNAPSDESLLQGYKCRRCGHGEAQSQRILVNIAGLGWIRNRVYLAVTCTGCGATEFFDTAILEQRGDWEEFFRSLFR